MARVLIPEQLSEAGTDVLRAAGHDPDVRLGLSAAELVDEMRDAAALVVRSATNVTKDVIDAAAALRVVARAGVGVDNIDLDAARSAGVVVCNAPSANVTSAAELTVGLILAVARNIAQANQSMHAGRWERGQLGGVELAHRTAGIIGLGRVGRLVAARLAAFEMELLAYDPYVSAESVAQAGARKCELAELLSASDVITVHLTKTPETVNLLNHETLANAKRGAMLINTARGGVVNDEALCEHLDSQHLRGAGIDTWENEPNVSSPLLGRSDVVATPHLGASTSSAQNRAAVAAAQGVCDVLGGVEPEFRVV